MRRRARGFTLVEMLVGLAILIILVTIAVPGFQGFAADQGTKNAAQTLYATLLYARTEAIKRNTTVHVLPLGGTGADWAEGWMVSTDAGAADIDCGDTASNAGVLQAYCGIGSTGVTVSPAPDQVRYESSGRSAATRFRVCASGATRGRDVRVELGGLPMIAVNGECS